MPNKTTNYLLSKPTLDENYDIKIQNNNMDIIDNEIKKVDTQLSDIQKEVLSNTFTKISTDAQLTSLPSVRDGFVDSMIIKGKTRYKKADGTYTDTFEDGVTLESTGEAEGNKISILTKGKNLFDIKNFSTSNNVTIENIPDGYILSGDGSWKALSYNFKLVPNKEYYLKLNRKWLSGDKQTCLVVKDSDNKIIDEWRQEGRYGLSEYRFIPKSANITILIYASAGNTSKIEVTNIILSESNINYEDHKQDKTEILLKEPLMGLPNGVCDVIDVDKNEHVRNVGKRAYQTGDETNVNLITDKVNTYYQLATPVVEKLDVIEPLQTFENGYIQLDNAITPSVSLNYSTDLSSIIGKTTEVVDKLADRLATLEELVLSKIANP